MAQGDEVSQREVSSQEIGISVTTEFLYLRGNEEGLAYGMETPVSFDLNPYPYKIIGQEGQISPAWGPGARLTIDYTIPHFDWDAAIIGTYYTTSSSSSLAAPTGGVLWPFWMNGSPGAAAQSASASWAVQFGTLDLELGGLLQPNPSVQFRPHFGVRCAWIHQNLNVTYYEAFLTVPLTGVTDHSYNQNNFNGYGVRCGMDSHWIIARGWSLFVNGALSILEGFFSLSQKEYASNQLRTDIQNENNEFVTAAFDLLGGIAWQTSLRQDRYLLGFRLGFESQVWFSQNQLNRFMDDFNHGQLISEKGNLSLFGGTFQVNCSF